MLRKLMHFAATCSVFLSIIPNMWRLSGLQAIGSRAARRNASKLLAASILRVNEPGR